MLDTVPKGAELTEVITPLPVKPSILTMLFDNDTVQLSGEVRVCPDHPPPTNWKSNRL
jgi:hypothetical protein